MTTVQQCIATASEHYGVSELDICSDRQDVWTVVARFAAYWLARQETRFSLAAIGRVIGDRDRSTVGYGIRQMEARRAEHDTFRAETDRLREKLYADYARDGVSYGA